MHSILYIVAIYFFIGFFSDVILNYLSRQTFSPESIKALNVYFMRKSNLSPFVRDIVSAIYAGLTIVVILFITMFISNIVFEFNHPRKIKELIKFMILAFPIGYIADVIIYHIELFGPSLNHFYEIAGAGFWGAIAFLFAIRVSYIFLKI